MIMLMACYLRAGPNHFLNYKNIRVLSINNYYDFINTVDNLLVLVYQDFCSHSFEAIENIKYIHDVKDFEGITIGVLDLQQNEYIKKAENIEKVPRIFLYHKGSRITYNDAYDNKLLEKFIREKLNFININKINTLEDLETLKENNSLIFYFTGNDSNHKYKIFKSGYITYLDYKFVLIENPKILHKYNLRKNTIGVFHKTFGVIKYQKAFKFEYFTQWVKYITSYEDHQIDNKNFVNKFISEKQLYFLIIYKTNEEYFKFNKYIFKNFNKIQGRFLVLNCNINNEYCKLAMDKIKLTEKSKYNFHIVMNLKELLLPIVYTNQEDVINSKSVSKFIKDFDGHNIKYNIVSSDAVNIANDYFSNIENLKMISRNNYVQFFNTDLTRDIIILFINSDINGSKLNQVIAEAYKKFIIKNNSVKEYNVIFGYYYLDLNTHEFLKLYDKNIPFIRLYQFGYLNHFTDISYNANNIQNLDNIVNKFLVDNINSFYDSI